MSNFFTEHKFILSSAVGLALLVISPALLFPFMAGDAYKGINIGEWSDDFHYIAKGREILEGHSLGNIFLKIGKNDSSDPHQVYIEYLLLAPVKLLGLSRAAVDYIVPVYTLYAFLGVVLLIFSIYFFILRLSAHKLLSAAIALFTIGGYSLVKLYHVPITATNPDPNIFSRPIMPVYGLLALFIYINLLARSLKSSERKHVLWSGIAFGALFYVYPYTWTFASALTGSLFLIYLCLRDWESAKKVFWVSAIGLAVGAYTLFKTFSFQYSEIGKQILYYGTTLNHAPAPFSKILFLVLILSIIFAYRNKWGKNAPLLLSVVLANWIALNQQVITGRVPQLMHYFWYFTIPTSIVVGAYLGWALVCGAERGKLMLRKYGTIFLAALIIAAYFNAASRQYQVTLITREAKEYRQNYRPIIDALKSDAEPGVVLASSLPYAMLFPVYTHHDLFWGHATALVYNTPMERITDSLYVYMYLDKDARDNFLGRLRDVDAGYGVGGEWGTSFYPLIYFFVAGFNSGFDYEEYGFRLAKGDPAVIKSRAEMSALLFREYQKVASPEGIAGILKKGEVNYIVWDKNKNPEWDLSPLSENLREVAASNNIYLYAFSK
ncbi:hypothetical protein A2661_00575 [Candidatus Giovannonibacteria bacterium RIFCSPHIGHO2_01_FULL_45_24]|uniref:Glycosyltransferase RgtA/B/C/D-like domain-containing protein n=1 Tax=Candidatus Giovannonibacteria bacterium RIFCSPLOWO2_01_FULL_46_32 TaxID=1798353 RepID=A0A1F5XHW3_9BACT|nr:MAG: hypothetical protein A2661_00575 [Candidatus Giovannonibacteria bacterium RIFCSPHIGHO2_01_FULL_45_24]OGF87071.1 MAG: hypothetical protein A3B19_01415 [Candidatus Giovannonibacteria bacterium RIFCSPLOWO2_01_FULL_46_32]